MNDRGMVFVVGVIILVVGLGLVYWGYTTVQVEQAAIENAEEIEVQIVETEIVTRERTRPTDDDSFSDDTTGSGTETETVYQPQVRFTYEYDGEQYHSSNVFPAGGTFPEYSERSAAENQLQSYPEGQTVTGYVDPNDPGEAFLKRQESAAPRITMFVGGLFVLAGLGWLVARFRS